MIPVQFWDLSQLSDLEFTEELARTQEGKTVTLGQVYTGIVPCYSPEEPTWSKGKCKMYEELLDMGPESTLIVINLEPPQAPISVGASGVEEEDDEWDLDQSLANCGSVDILESHFLIP